MQYKPFGPRLMIKPLEDNFILADKTVEQVGEVVAIGPDVKSIKKGDMIVFTPWGLDPFKTPEGEQYYFIPESYEFILATKSV